MRGKKYAIARDKRQGIVWDAREQIHTKCARLSAQLAEFSCRDAEDTPRFVI
jgi:hypothetical protein